MTRLTTDTDAGQAPLQGLVGREVDQVVFVMDYLQLGFHQGWWLSLYAWPEIRLRGSGRTLLRNVDDLYEHVLVGLIGATVTGASDVEGISVELDEDTAVFLPADAGYVGGSGEFGMLQWPDQHMWVWRTDSPPFDAYTRD